MSQDKTLEEELKELVVETQIQPKELVSMALKTLEEHLDEFLKKLYANEVQELLKKQSEKFSNYSLMEYMKIFSSIEAEIKYALSPERYNFLVKDTSSL